MTGHLTDVKDVLSKLAVWLLSGVVTIVCVLVYDMHRAVDNNTSQLESRWTHEFYDQLGEAIRYPLIHESYRELYVAQNEAFHEQVRQFMGAGGRFSADRGDALEERIRRLEQNCAVLMERPVYKGGRHFYNNNGDPIENGWGE